MVEESMISGFLKQEGQETPASLPEARRQVETLVAMGLAGMLSRHEVINEASGIVSRFEELLHQVPEPWGGGAHEEDDGLSLTLENRSGVGGISILIDEIPALIGILGKKV